MSLKHLNKTDKEINEKNFVTLSSVIAAFFLTGTKLIIGILTGSLGILSEALHSGLDLIAAIMTFFAVRISDKPADEDHQFGHGKIENLSALIETFLLLITCFWIIYEAVNRLQTGKTEILVTYWSFGVVIFSIIVDISRSRALSRVAKKYKSQAMEADALHFSTDILSSAVVLIGLVGSYFNYHIADAISALLVALIVIVISFRLGKRSIDALLDRSPSSLTSEQIIKLVQEIPEVFNVHDIRLRTSGPNTFIELNIHVHPNISIQKAHEISHQVEALLHSKIERCSVHIHTEPEHSD
ncbi:MAG: cation diffusion facilitator family transporter [Bacteroidota bacterium]